MKEALIMESWLQKIESAQAGAAGASFPTGSIPSYRIYPLTNTSRADPNVFFPALVANKLLEWQQLMDKDQKKRSASIVSRIQETFYLYRSRRGRTHYNFWPTRPDVPFPNGKVLRHFDFFRLPDDIDDTALVFAASEQSSESVGLLRHDIEKHLLRFYAKEARLYPVWLGDKMPFVADACALANLLCLFAGHGLTPTSFSAASARFLKTLIANQTYIHQPYEVSPYYPDTAVIAYHLSRWLAADEAADGDTKEKFISDVQDLACREKNPFRAMLYSSSLFRLKTAGTLVEYAQIKPWVTTFPWFFGSMLSAVQSKTVRRFGSWKLFHIAHVCECWNQSLWTEYLLFRDNYAIKTTGQTRRIENLTTK